MDFPSRSLSSHIASLKLHGRPPTSNKLNLVYLSEMTFSISTVLSNNSTSITVPRCTLFYLVILFIC